MTTMPTGSNNVLLFDALMYKEGDLCQGLFPKNVFIVIKELRSTKV